MATFRSKGSKLLEKMHGAGVQTLLAGRMDALKNRSATQHLWWDASMDALQQ
jgi:hypothetical protein